ncbi:MAG: beta-glucosidase [Anaerolineaceae bacterium]|nr:MAG: beta-glucosidase [Anaerolineaceae bacterium]
MAKITFPDGFVWGAATASYQIEGAATADGRGASIWDTFSATPGKVLNGDTGAVACDHYNRYPDDIRLMRDQIGLDAYRFSIAWPRILPQGDGAVNPAGLDFYDRLVDGLLEAGITPYATLFHWDLPQALEDRGGWPHRGVVDAYINYADVTTRRLGDRVKHWMTFNEPWVFTFLGYCAGIHAPGKTSWADYLAGMHHFLLAHGGAVPVIRQNSADASVGLVLNLNWADAASDSAEDQAAVARAMSFQNNWILDPLYRGEYPADMVALYDEAGIMPEIRDGDMARIQGAPDFLGVNFYTRLVVRHDDSVEILRFSDVPQSGEHTEMGWEVSPESLYRLLMWTWQNYAPEHLYITENGAAFADEVSADGAVHDERRLNFYREYLTNVHRAITEGVPMRGYFAWSLLDNFEWAEGYSKRFGITYVDYETQQRILKDSGKWYAQVIENNGF